MIMLDRRDTLRTLLRDRGNMIVVGGLGSSAYDLAACGNEPLDFPMWGAMGGAAMVGLGLALAQRQRPVLVVTGDGEMLMGMGSLATIAVQPPRNLRLLIFDNQRFGETGQQYSHTAYGTDLAAVAHGCGVPHTRTIDRMDELAALRDDLHSLDGLLLAVVKVSPEALPRVLPPRDGAYLTHRIREALLGPDRAPEG